jgi:hypothetical protein
MADVVVTVPMGRWAGWIAEGDLPGEPWSGAESYFGLGGPMPEIAPGERVYVVAFGRLRGYAPLVCIDSGPYAPGFDLVRHGGAVACTIPEPIRGFRGWRYVWWDRADEQPFPDWRTAGVALALAGPPGAHAGGAGES